MVDHGSNKKRRRGMKVTRKPRKHKNVRVLRSIVSQEIKNLYDKEKSPKENFQAMGLVTDSNKLLEEKPVVENYPAFLGYADQVTGMIYQAPNSKNSKNLGQLDSIYAENNIKKHGDNYKAMERDLVSNPRQLSEAQISKLIKKYKKSTGETTD